MSYRSAALCLSPIALSLCTQALAAPPNAVHTVAAGTHWEVTSPTTLQTLTIFPRGTLSAAAGHTLTMTVDGVETPIAPGEYHGRIVLTPADDIDVTFDGMGTKQVYKYRAAVYVKDGYRAAQSVPSAVAGGQVSASGARDVTIRSNGPRFNGIVVSGKDHYAIEHATIELHGNGKNDFNGIGAAIRAGGDSHVTIGNTHIDNTGAVRTAIWVGDHSDTTINNSTIEVHNGVLPPDYGWSWVHGGGGASGDVMMEVPWMLGLVGNNRATLVTGHGTARYNHCEIKAQAWGALSTDAVEEARVYANHSHIVTVEHGYGGYADGNSLVYSDGSTWDVADYGLIMSGGSGVFTNHSVVKSRRIGVMDHGGNRGTLTIDKGSRFETEEAVIQLKSSSPTILVDGAELHSKRGLILQAMINDDPNKNRPGPPPGGPAGAPAGAGGPPPGAPPEPHGRFSANDGDNDIDATFKHVTLQGDFINALTSQSAMHLTFSDARITGAMSTATAVHDKGPHGETLVMQEKPDLYYLIGEEHETLAPTADPHGVSVALKGASHWTVARTSYLNELSIEPGSSVSAPAGKQLTLTVDGSERPVAEGSYRGNIVLRVTG